VVQKGGWAHIMGEIRQFWISPMILAVLEPQCVPFEEKNQNSRFFSSKCAQPPFCTRPFLAANATGAILR
jgi:hypothetical protein